MQFNNKEIRQHIISFRLTGLEAGKIDELVKNSNLDLSTSEACRALCLKYIKQRPPAPPKRHFKARRKPHLDTEKVARSLGLIGQVATDVSYLKTLAEEHHKLPEIGTLHNIQQNLVDIKVDLSKAMIGGIDGN